MDKIVLLTLILVLLAYVLYKVLKKEIHKDKIGFFTNIILILTMGLFIYYLSNPTPIFRYSIDKIEANGETLAHAAVKRDLSNCTTCTVALRKNN